MVLPVLMLYGDEYSGATPQLLGLALGIYGLTQAIFQIPLGLLSDFIGRKIVIVAGLVLFAVGSVVAATATSIEGLIIGRALQGSGAIASTIMAMVADLTSEESRTKAMAAIGASIGVSFTLAMIIGPAVAAFAGLFGIFVLSALLSLGGILVLLTLVPTPRRIDIHHDVRAVPSLILSTLANKHLLRLNWGIFVLHALLMTSFVVIPVVLLESLRIERAEHWIVYLPVMLLAFICMLPIMIVAEKKRRVKSVFILAIAVLAVAFALLALYHNTYVALLAIFIFFVAFNLLEAVLPSWVSKISPPGAKGTAMGLYSSSQFIGAFLGGVAGGWLLENMSITTVFIVCVVACGMWVLIAAFMQPPKYLNSICVEVRPGFSDVDRIMGFPGVEEIRLVPEEAKLYMKVDQREFHRSEFEIMVKSAVR